MNKPSAVYRFIAVADYTRLKDPPHSTAAFDATRAIDAAGRSIGGRSGCENHRVSSRDGIDHALETQTHTHASTLRSTAWAGRTCGGDPVSDEDYGAT